MITQSIALKAPITSPAFLGIPTAPNPTGGTNSTQIATTAFVVASFAPITNPTFAGSVVIPASANLQVVIIESPVSNTQIRLRGDQVYVGNSISIEYFGTKGGNGTDSIVSIGAVGVNTKTSGQSSTLSLIPFYNQSGSVGSNIDFLINRTVTLIGSGTQLYIGCQTNTGAYNFYVSAGGFISGASGIAFNGTSAPGGGVGTLTNAPASSNPNVWMPVIFNGTSRLVPGW